MKPKPQEKLFSLQRTQQHLGGIKSDIPRKDQLAGTMFETEKHDLPQIEIFKPIKEE